MVAKTRFSALQFWVLWRHYATSGEHFPRSLIYNGDPELGYDAAQDLYAKVRLDSLEEISSKAQEMFRVLTRPDYRVAMNGFNAQAPADHAARVRVYSAWAGDVAVVAHQVANTDPTSGGDVLVWPVSTAAWMSTLIDLLPDGRKGTLPVVTDLAGHHPDSSRITTLRDEDVAAARAKFRDMQTSHGGFIVITAGRPDEPKIEHRFHYFDRVDDGRYLATFGEYIDVEPADSGVLDRRLTQTLNSARQRLDELRGVSG